MSKKFLSDVLIECGLQVSGTTTLGTATATTVATSDNSTNIATTAWVKSLGYSTTDSFVSDVSLSGSTLTFTGINSAFTGSIDLSNITSSFNVSDVTTVYERVKNVSGNIIYKGTPLSIVPGQTAGNISDVRPADAADPARMPALFIANEDIADQAEGEVVLSGKITGIDTSLYQSGTTIYVAAGGGFTDIKPVHPNLIQNLGVIAKEHPSNGAAIITGVGRANALPNLTAGKLWVGSATYPIESTTVHVDEANGRFGIGTTSPTQKLDVNGDVQILNNLYFVDSNNKVVVDQSTGTAFDFHLNTQNIASLERYGTDSGQFQIKQYSTGNTADNGPAYSFKGDTNTGMALFGADSLALVTGGDTKLIVNAAGNVGIGTTAPSSKLTVEDTIGIKRSGVNAISTLQQTGAGLEVNAPDGYHPLIIKHNGTEYVRFRNDGNVGIGTASPDAPLTVTNNAVSSYIINVNMADDVDGGGFYEATGGMELYLKDTSGTGQVKLTSSGSSYLNGGNVGIGTTTPGYLLDVAGNAAITGGNRLWFKGGSDIGLENAASDNAIYIANTGAAGSSVLDIGTGTVVIQEGGNVGIGTTSPEARLHIAGGHLLLNNGIELRSKDTGGSVRTIARVNGSTNDLEYGWSGAGAVKFMGGGAYTERMRIHTDGNVGIGTTSPDSGLTISRSNQYASLNIYKADTTNQIVYLGTGSSGADDDAVLQLFDEATEKVRIFTAGSSYFNGGDVGIGTTSPAKKLTVATDTVNDGVYVTTSGGTSIARIGTSSTATSGALSLLAGGSTKVFISAKANENSYFNGGGNVGIGTTSPTAKLSVELSGTANQRLANFRNTGGNSFIEIQSSGNGAIGFWTAANNAFSIYQNATAGTIGTSVLYVDASANVGIGTTSPTYKLDVNGSIRSSGVNGLYIDASTAFGDNSGGGLSILNLGSTRALRIVGSSNNGWGNILLNPYGANVGIGTTEPNRKLHVESSGVIADFKSTTTQGLVDIIGTSNQLRIGTFSGVVGLAHGTGTSPHITIASGGNVGIGTTSPATKLHIDYTTGTGLTLSNTVANLYAEMRLQSASSSAYIFKNSNGYSPYGGGDALNIFNEGQIAFHSSTRSNIMYLTAAGKVGIGTTNPVHGDLEVYKNGSNATITIHEDAGTAQAILHFRTGGNDTYFRNTPAGFNISTEGFVDAITFATTGNVGIGTTNPTEKIHVVGNVQIEGGSTSVVLETNNKGADPAGTLFGEYDITTTYGAIVDYVIYDAGRDNMRSGTFSAVWNVAETRYNDVSTVDIGDTSVVTLTSQINGANVELIVTGDAVYTIKFNTKLIK